MTKKKKNQNNFKRLYWKDNKEKIIGYNTPIGIRPTPSHTHD